MVIDIKGTSISIPSYISDWVKENEDNRTEFFGMLDSIMYAVNTYFKNKFKPTPYDWVYEQQLEDCKAMGMNREQSDEYISGLIKQCWDKANKKCENDGTNALLRLMGLNT